MLDMEILAPATFAIASPDAYRRLSQLIVWYSRVVRVVSYGGRGSNRSSLEDQRTSLRGL
jgi:hypothetical protein